MNPYQKAIKQKKFEGLKIEISPIEDREEMEQAASNGDGAPEVLDEQPEVAMSGEGIVETPEELVSEDMPEVSPEDMDSEEVFGMQAPQGKPNSLKERAMQMMKRKK